MSRTGPLRLYPVSDKTLGDHVGSMYHSTTLYGSL